MNRCCFLTLFVSMEMKSNIFLDIFPIPLKTPVKQPTSKHPTCEDGFLVFHIAMKCRQTTVTFQLIVQKNVNFWVKYFIDKKMYLSRHRVFLNDRD